MANPFDRFGPTPVSQTPAPLPPLTPRPAQTPAQEAELALESKTSEDASFGGSDPQKKAGPDFQNLKTQLQSGRVTLGSGGGDGIAIDAENLINSSCGVIFEAIATRVHPSIRLIYDDLYAGDPFAMTPTDLARVAAQGVIPVSTLFFQNTDKLYNCVRMFELSRVLTVAINELNLKAAIAGIILSWKSRVFRPDDNPNTMANKDVQLYTTGPTTPVKFATAHFYSCDLIQNVKDSEDILEEHSLYIELMNELISNIKVVLDAGKYLAIDNLPDINVFPEDPLTFLHVNERLARLTRGTIPTISTFFSNGTLVSTVSGYDPADRNAPTRLCDPVETDSPLVLKISGNFSPYSGIQFTSNERRIAVNGAFVGCNAALSWMKHIGIDSTFTDSQVKSVSIIPKPEKIMRAINERIAPLNNRPAPHPTLTFQVWPNRVFDDNGTYIGNGTQPSGDFKTNGGGEAPPMGFAPVYLVSPPQISTPPDGFYDQDLALYDAHFSVMSGTRRSQLLQTMKAPMNNFLGGTSIGGVYSMVPVGELDGIPYSSPFFTLNSSSISQDQYDYVTVNPNPPVSNLGTAGTADGTSTFVDLNASFSNDSGTIGKLLVFTEGGNVNGPPDPARNGFAGYKILSVTNSNTLVVDGQITAGTALSYLIQVDMPHVQVVYAELLDLMTLPLLFIQAVSPTGSGDLIKGWASVIVENTPPYTCQHGFDAAAAQYPNGPQFQGMPGPAVLTFTGFDAAPIFVPPYVTGSIATAKGKFSGDLTYLNSQAGATKVFFHMGIISNDYSPILGKSVAPLTCFFLDDATPGTVYQSQTYGVNVVPSPFAGCGQKGWASQIPFVALYNIPMSVVS